jgi:hypothetical protein
MYSETGFTRSDKIIAHVALNYAALLFKIESIDIATPNRFDTTVDDEGLTIENSDVVILDDNDQQQLALRETSQNGQQKLD